MSIPRDIKRIASDYIIFPGVSNEDFRNLFNDSTLSCFKYDELWNKYIALTDSQKMLVAHTKTREMLTV